MAQEITIIAGLVEPAQLPAEHAGAVPVTPRMPGMLESKGCTAKLYPLPGQNRSARSGTLLRKGFLIWSSCQDVVCTLEYLRRDSWGKAGYLSY